MTNLFPRQRPARTGAVLLLALMVIAAGGSVVRAADEQESDHAAHEESGHEKSGSGHQEDGNDEGERVRLDAKQRSHLDLELFRSRAGMADSVLKAPAEFHLDPDRRYRVGPLVRSKVVRVTADLGDVVEAGDTLAVLSSVELGQAKSRYRAALARHRTAQQACKRERRLAEQNISSEAEVLDARADAESARAELEAARTALELYGVSGERIEALARRGGEQPGRFELTAPAGGTVEHRDVSPGATLGDADTPFTLVDTSRLWAMLLVNSERVDEVAQGDRVRIRIEGQDASVEGRVSWISRTANASDRRVRVRAVVDNPDGRLRPGVFGQGEIFSATGADADSVLVPLDAVQRVGERQVVFVPGDHDGEYRVRPVETGTSGERFIEIRSGLAAGTRVVASGAFDLKAALTAGGRSAAHGH